jgi:hypothetical protein
VRQFKFDKDRVTAAVLNRKVIGERAALTIGLFLISHYPGQLVIPDFGFYGREAHASLVREKRLVAGVNTLQELTPKLRQTLLLMQEKTGKGTTYQDAETLARYAKKAPGTNEFNSYVDSAMSD